jgi:hypothetical protein
MGQPKADVMSAHPLRCAGCRGCGYTDGPPIIETIGGRPHVHTTVRPCTHEWWHDDTGYDPHYDDPISWDHPRARSAYERGYRLGQADLYEISGGQLGAPLTNEETA